MKKFYMAIVSSIAITAVIGCLILIFIVVPASATPECEPLTVTELFESFSTSMYEIVDNETGVCYLYTSGAYKASITPMYQADGTLKVKR